MRYIKKKFTNLLSKHLSFCVSRNIYDKMFEKKYTEGNKKPNKNFNGIVQILPTSLSCSGNKKYRKTLNQVPGTNDDFYFIFWVLYLVSNTFGEFLF